MKNIVLDSSAKSIVAFLAAAPATTNPSFTSSYADYTSNSFAPGSNDGVLDGTTQVTLVAAPANGQRVVTALNIANTDTAAVALTIAYVSSGGTRIIWSGSLNPGDTWTMEHVIDSDGAIKKSGPIGVIWSGTDPAQAMSVAPGTVWYQPV